MRTMRIVLFSALVVASISGVTLAQSHYTFTSVATGYGYYEPATITNSGDVLFGPPLPTGGEGVLIWHRGTFTAAAKGGQPTYDHGSCWAPPPYDPSDCPVFGYTGYMQMNDAGEVGLVMTRDGINYVPTPWNINLGVYRYNRHSGVIPVMVPGMRAPGGGVFWGSWYLVSVPNNGNVYFSGMTCTTATVTYSTLGCPEGPGVLALGAYKGDPKGKLTAIAKPGDAAPGGSYFDFANQPAADERGDVLFAGHIFSDPCIPNPDLGGCWRSMFLKDGQTGRITTVARIGRPAPRPGKTYTSAGSTTMNAGGDVAFMADFSPANDFSDDAALFYSHGRTTVIAEVGDVMPDGILARVGTSGLDIAMNNAGDVAFDATLTDGTEAVYLWRHGRLSTVVKTGTQTPAGVISDLDDYGLGSASTALSINDTGQVLFVAHVQGGGNGVLMVAAPR